ncbi:MAG: HAMP domain-containing sensor histidine kinase, partial [Bacteroidota bacterium]|nr:HAMP domain-containing sensor histidine kinase [Bacteroidota bacterium]
MALKESEARLRDLNATKDKFFSIIAHDLKNPFNTIIGFSDLLTRKIQERDYEGISGYSRMIGNSSQRAMDLLTNLLKWACIQTGRIDFIPECIDMDELTSDIIKLLSNLAQQKSIAITTRFPPLVFVMADKEMISTVLRNLISNAVKFTNPGGEVVISAKPKQKEWMITIADNGV